MTPMLNVSKSAQEIALERGLSVQETKRRIGKRRSKITFATQTQPQTTHYDFGDTTAVITHTHAPLGAGA